ncbi:MAG: hypothetical protein IID33_14490 [Planctomycetes bacterium]|nr:hypothetical protein [Planctomycetota bacterium]
MPASKHGDVQTDKYDDCKFITMRVCGNGEPELERRRIAEVGRLGPLVPTLDHESAREELESIVCEFPEHEPGEIDDEVVDDWMRAESAEAQRQILLDLDVPAEYLAENPSTFTDLKLRGWKVNSDHRPRREALEALFSLPDGTLKEDRAAFGPRLSACIDEFRIEQKQRNNQPRHTNAYIRRFKAFADFLKDRHIKDLEKADFVRFADHVLSVKAGRSPKTIRDQLKPIEAVMECAQARMDDGAFPDAVDSGLKYLEREMGKLRYKPPMHNREPMPVDVFKRLLARADEWAELDWEADAKSLKIPKMEGNRQRALAVMRNRRIALHRKRSGLMAHSMLCLAANVGAQPVDFARLLWDELVLDGKLPLYKEDREKPAHLLGSDVPRCCPMLPATVKSLKRWQRWRRAELKTPSPEMEAAAQFVFTYDDGRPFNQEQSFGVTKLFRQLRKDEKAGKWQIRHLRNIGSTLCRDAHLPTDMATAWLGHSAGGTNKFYMGEAKEDYLLPLMREIGRTYFR